jgi:hypothetical protein
LKGKRSECRELRGEAAGSVGQSQRELKGEAVESIRQRQTSVFRDSTERQLTL